MAVELRVVLQDVVKRCLCVAKYGGSCHNVYICESCGILLCGGLRRDSYSISGCF